MTIYLRYSKIRWKASNVSKRLQNAKLYTYISFRHFSYWEVLERALFRTDAQCHTHIVFHRSCVYIYICRVSVYSQTMCD